MGSSRLVVEISSDEEGDGDGDNFDCISKMLLNEQTDESDNAVILLNPKQMFQSSIGAVVKSLVKDLDDDECVILDGDPDKPVDIKNDGIHESDDLLVGENIWSVPNCISHNLVRPTPFRVIQTQSVLDPTVTDFEINCVLAENSQLQCMGSMGEMTSFVTQFDGKFNGSANTGSLGLEFENWRTDNQLNLFFPGATLMDPGGKEAL
ncbi:hypothetical protein LguiB_000427 [Lonicera macranthoides]